MQHKKIIIVHPGKANYPELDAYKAYFSNMCFVEIVKKEALQQKVFDKDTVLWFIMGFYPEKYQAGFIIHDYRSLSVGKLSKIKDLIKRYLNHLPDARIFLNESIATEIKFSDGKPEFFLDMGVPASIINYAKLKISNIIYDYIYVGDISYERDIHVLLKNFLNDQHGKKLLLVGTYNEKIYQKYAHYSFIDFKGKVPQEKVFELISQSDICLNYIPDKYPFTCQTSTKLLEYAALGKKIISNKTPAILESIRTYGINVLLVDGYSVPKSDNLSDLQDNSNFNIDALLWEKIIKASKIENAIC